eukprot:COSAG05_NODE_1509_length_4688_cov_77.656788_3_plen_95_part_00
MQELCRRNGVAVPDLVNSTGLDPTSSAARHIVVLVICNSDSASFMLSDLQSAVTNQELSVTLTSDEANIASADRVLLLLSRGVLTGDSLSQLES